MHLPKDYDPDRSYPLVLMLHGYSVNGMLQNIVLQLVERVTSHQYVLIVPEGTVNSRSHQFWNAWPQCCNFDNQEVDDVEYLTALVEEAKEHVTIDDSRVGSVGHSNGGYMSYRLACERPDVFSRIVSVAGSMPLDPELCNPDGRVSVLQAHGTNDETVPYFDNQDTEGGDGHGIYTRGAEASVQDWLTHNGCPEDATLSEALDLSVIAGDETQRTHWDCGDSVSVELWRIEGGDHLLLERNTEFQDRIAAFLVAP